MFTPKFGEDFQFDGHIFSKGIPLEHAPDLQPPVYEGIPFIWGFGDAWGMLQGYVRVLLDYEKQGTGFAILALVLEQWKKGPWLFRVYVGDESLPSYMGIIS